MYGRGNSFATFVARMLFSLSYSPWKLHVKVAAGQRKQEIAKATNKDKIPIVFDR
jgi:hypothetical protein